jgi:hypothetical protein
MARRSVLECVQEEGVQVVSVAAVLVSSWRRRRWQWSAIPARNRGAGELGLERENGLSTKREGRGFPDRRQPSPFAVGLLRLGAQQRQEKMVSMATRFYGERESGREANERQGRVPEGVSSFISRGGLGLGCSGSGNDWASRAALRGGVVHWFQGRGHWRGWLDGLVRTGTVSEP